jgi:hypothetical protein
MVSRKKALLQSSWAEIPEKIAAQRFPLATLGQLSFLG